MIKQKVEAVDTICMMVLLLGCISLPPLIASEHPPSVQAAPVGRLGWLLRATDFFSHTS